MWIIIILIVIFVIMLINSIIDSKAKREGCYEYMQKLGTEEISSIKTKLGIVCVSIATVVLLALPSIITLILWFIILCVGAIFNEKLARYITASELKKRRLKPTGKNKAEKPSLLEIIGVYSIFDSLVNKKKKR